MKIKNSGMITIGVTGGIGSGKSEVCKMFAALGAYVISADDLAKEIMEKNEEVSGGLVKAFGEDIYTPERKLNRSHLAKIVFSDETATKKINALVHPHVLKRMRQIIAEEETRHQTNILVFEAALIYESGADKMLDYVVVVDAGKQTRLRRAVERHGISREDVLRRMKAQLPSEQKVRRADFAIDNNGDLQSLKRSVEFLYNLFMKTLQKRDGGPPRR